MADLSRTIQIVFEGVDNTAGVFGQLAGDLGNFADSVEAATQPFADITKSLVAAEAAVGALGIAFGAAAISVSGEFHSAIEEVGTLFGATDDEVAQLSDSVLNFAKDSVFSIEDINDALYKAVSNTGDWTTSMDLLADAEKLAVAGVTGLSSAVDALTVIMGAYGLEVGDAARISDALFTTVQNGNTTMDEIVAVLSRLAAGAAGAGIPIEDLGAALAALTIASGDTAQSATYLDALIREMVNPSDKLADAMGGLTVESDGLDAVMKQLLASTGGTSTGMYDVFSSSEAAKGAIILANDAAGVFAKTLEQMGENAGATAAAYAAMVDEIEKINQRLENNIDVLLIKVGEQLSGSYKDLVDGIIKALQGIGEGLDEGAFDPILQFFADNIDKIAELFAGIGEALPEALEQVNFDALVDAMDALLGKIGDLFTGLFGDLDLTKPEDLAKAIQGVVDAIAALTNANVGIFDEFGKWAGNIHDLAVAFLNMDPDDIRSIGSGLASLTVLNEISGYIGSAVTAFQALGGALGVLLAPSILTSLGQMGTLLGTGATGLAGAMSASATAAPVLAGAITAVAAAFAGWKLSEWMSENNFLGINDGIDAMAQAFAELTHESLAAEEPLGRLDMNLANVSLSTGLVVDSMDEFNRLVADGVIVYDQATQSWVQAGDAVSTLGDSVDGTNKGLDGTEAAAKSAGRGLDDLGGAASGAERDSDDLRKTLESIASNERIKSMEFQMKLDIAEVEANAEISIAALESLSATITSTGDLLGKLYGMLGDPDLGDWDRQAILDQIEAENAARQEALELQRDLTQAQIDYMQARVDALEKSDALVTIDGSGLQPHLEAFMWEILRTIQVRVNEDGLEFLVGL